MRPIDGWEDTKPTDPNEPSDEDNSQGYWWVVVVLLAVALWAALADYHQ